MSRGGQGAISTQRIVLLAIQLLGFIAGGTAGWQLGLALDGAPPGTLADGAALRYVLVLTVAGAALGLLILPYISIVPLRRL
ncbi:MAG: hypothetical protein M3442_03650, partial [Chloroflexota bacterium]|nr:hypothetical protein [Chloroflexota bacterium]